MRGDEVIALDLDRGSRVGLAMAGFLAPVALGVVLRLVGEAGVVEAIAPPREAALCDARRLDAVCEAEALCIAGVCRADPSAVRRRLEGESCEGRQLCDAGLECHRGACKAVEALPIADPICRGPAVRPVIDSLARACASEKHVSVSQVDLTSCDAAAWETMARGRADFDARFVLLPGAFALFFPNDQPKATGGFPSPAQREHLAATMREHEGVRAAMARARVMMAIGRASRAGDRITNTALARRRARLAAELVGDVRRSLGMESRAVLELGLADQSPVPVESMRRFLAPPIAASEADAREILESVASAEESAAAGEEASEAVNRVALVVAFPCDGSEFFPESAFYTKSAFTTR
ncbi:MAG TPA: hypothetical protein PKW35_14865 [Nannocystaceae bacterium]|nr:hypothetical protein [Nannocystaceae bacterium]